MRMDAHLKKIRMAITSNSTTNVKTPIQGMMIIDLQIATKTKVQIPPLKTNTFNNSRQMHVTI